MKLFACPNCNQVLYFENNSCAQCGELAGYIPDLDIMTSVEASGAVWIAKGDPGKPYRFCRNWEFTACNWLVEAESPTPYCRACQHNRTIPDISQPANHFAWSKIESAKRRLFYSILKLKLPLPQPNSGHGEPLMFDILQDQPGAKVLTGHQDGIITLSLREADDSQREQLRTSMNEPYRTLLGHFRHEVGHYYWDLLVRDRDQLESFRAIFGDERADYEQARQTYYANGPLPDWQDSYVSAYATMHPWEDFAESWAHFLHIVDTLEMAVAFGLQLMPTIEAAASLRRKIDIDPYTCESATELISEWLPTTFAVNSLNRAMGQPDLYPFIISPAVIAKLEYVRTLVVPDPKPKVETERRAGMRSSLEAAWQSWKQRNRPS